MTTFPVLIDQVGATQGTQLAASALDVYVQAQTYLMTGGIASTATGLSVTQPATQAVINPLNGAPNYVNVAATSVPLPAGPVVSQDVYVDLDSAGAYHVTGVNHGAGAPTQNGGPNGSGGFSSIRLYFATTNANNTAVSSYTALAPTSPLAAIVAMNTTGTNAGAVAFPSTLSVAGATTLNGNLSVPGTSNLGVLNTTGLITAGGNLAMGNQQIVNAARVGIGTAAPLTGLHLANVIAATANLGLASIGPGPFDGVTAGKFVGQNASGTLIAGNTAAGFGGTLLDLQVGGVSKAHIDSGGNVGVSGSLNTGGGIISAGAFTASSTATFGGKVFSTGTAPTCSNGSSAGVGASCSLASWSTDRRGQVFFTTGNVGGSGGIPAGVEQLVHVLFSGAYPSSNYVVVVVGNYQALGFNYVATAANQSTTGFDIYINSQQTIASGNAMNFYYWIEA